MLYSQLGRNGGVTFSALSLHGPHGCYILSWVSMRPIWVLHSQLGLHEAHMGVLLAWTACCGC